MSCKYTVYGRFQVKITRYTARATPEKFSDRWSEPRKRPHIYEARICDSKIARAREGTNIRLSSRRKLDIGQVIELELRRGLSIVHPSGESIDNDDILTGIF